MCGGWCRVRINAFWPAVLNPARVRTRSSGFDADQPIIEDHVHMQLNRWFLEKRSDQGVFFQAIQQRVACQSQQARRMRAVAAGLVQSLTDQLHFQFIQAQPCGR